MAPNLTLTAPAADFSSISNSPINLPSLSSDDYDYENLKRNLSKGSRKYKGIIDNESSDARSLSVTGKSGRTPPHHSTVRSVI